MGIKIKWSNAEMFDDKLSLIDDSGAGGTTTVGEGGRVFNVVSGSITVEFTQQQQMKFNGSFLDYSILI